MSVDRPQFQISGPGPSFTVYLSNDPELEAGLLYLDGPGFNHERLINPQNKHERNTKLKLFSHYHPYKTGNIYIHQEVAHSIFAKNYSDFTKFRLSLQGHLTKTKRGYLLFW